MDEATLIRRLEEFEPPQAEASRERARQAVRVRFGTGATPRPHRRRLLPGGLRLAVAMVAICATFAAGAVFTVPGKAVTSWVGERLGFGEPGGPPTLRDLRAFATHGSAAEGQPAYVLLRGPAADVGHYELITYRAKDEPGKEWPANGARCFELNFPEARSLYAPSCGLPPAELGLRFEGLGGGSGPGMAFQYASGRVSDDIEAVEVSFNGESVPVELTPIPEELIERFQIRRPFKFFIAFLEDFRQGGVVVVTARDGDGRAVVSRKRLFGPEGAPGYKSNGETASVDTDPGIGGRHPLRLRRR